MKNSFLSIFKSVKAKMMITVLSGIALLFAMLLINNNYSDRLIRERLDTTYDNMSELSAEYMELRIRKSDNIALDVAGNENVAILSSIYLAESGAYQSLSSIKDTVAEQINYHSSANEEIDSIYLYYGSRRTFFDSGGMTGKTDNPEVMDWVDKNTGWNTEIIWKDYNSEHRR